MSSKLFAFQLAKPATAISDEPLIGAYDPQTQTMAWQGSNQAYASLHCTGSSGSIGNNNCNAYGNYCSTWGSRHQYGYWCDS